MPIRCIAEYNVPSGCIFNLVLAADEGDSTGFRATTQRWTRSIGLAAEAVLGRAAGYFSILCSLDVRRQHVIRLPDSRVQLDNGTNERSSLVAEIRPSFPTVGCRLPAGGTGSPLYRSPRGVYNRHIAPQCVSPTWGCVMSIGEDGRPSGALPPALSLIHI